MERDRRHHQSGSCSGFGELSLSPEAALALALAGGAMRFSRSADDETARWLRILRLHGESACTLQALGVGESPLVRRAGYPPEANASGARLGPRAVPAVLHHARICAAAHGCNRLGTGELLIAVIHAYGGSFSEALRANGTSAGEVLERLAARRATA